MEKKINLKSLLPLPEVTIYVLLSLYEPKTMSSINRFLETESSRKALLKPELLEKVLTQLMSNHLIVKTTSSKGLDTTLKEFIISPLGKQILEIESNRLNQLLGSIRKFAVTAPISHFSKQ